MCPVPVPEDAAVHDASAAILVKGAHAASPASAQGEPSPASDAAGRRAPLFAFGEGRAKRPRGEEHGDAPVPAADGKQSTERSATSSAGSASPFGGYATPLDTLRSPLDGAGMLPHNGGPAMSGKGSPSSETETSSTQPSPSHAALPPMSEALRGAHGEEEHVGAVHTSQGSPGAKALHRCMDCGKVYKHKNCLVKHLWEHHEMWHATKRQCHTKHQQVQMLEAAHVLAEMALPAGMRTAMELTTLPPPSAGAFRSMMLPRATANAHIVPAAAQAMGSHGMYAHGVHVQGIGAQGVHVQGFGAHNVSAHNVNVHGGGAYALPVLPAAQTQRPGARLAPMAPKPRP